MRLSIIFCGFLAGILILSGQACQKDDDRYAVGTNNGIALAQVIAFTQVSPTNLEADSASLCTISVKIDRHASASNRNVRFYTDCGLFTNGDTVQIITANSEGNATAYLLSDKARKANIRVSVMNTYTIDTVINFLPARPDDLLLVADSYEGETDTNFQITSSLYRDPQRGLPSDPMKVLFTVVPLDTNINLIYPAFSLTENQVATITLENPFEVSGRFSVTAKTAAAIGDSISRTIQIRIN
jgi:hypothetical protein